MGRIPSREPALPLRAPLRARSAHRRSGAAPPGPPASRNRARGRRRRPAGRSGRHPARPRRAGPRRLLLRRRGALRPRADPGRVQANHWRRAPARFRIQRRDHRPCLSWGTIGQPRIDERQFRRNGFRRHGWVTAESRVGKGSIVSACGPKCLRCSAPETEGGNPGVRGRPRMSCASSASDRRAWAAAHPRPPTNCQASPSGELTVRAT